MRTIKILDCTLRDGGYVNDFNFGKNTIKNIISNLSDANIDIIECGFLSNELYDENKSLYNCVDSVKTLIEKKNNELMYVGMIALGNMEIPVEKIKPCDGSSIDGIRVTFHEDKHEMEKAFTLAKQLKDKGYAVFMQPIGTTTYSDESLLDLVENINDLNPYALYLVDTLGVMGKNELLTMFNLVDDNLNSNIAIGFHSHNNLQLSFSNAKELIEQDTDRNIIIDSSVFGMGRGAGNLCTELLANHINSYVGEKYDVVPLLEIVDEHLNQILARYSWGYSVPYFLAAIHNCHPNYVSYLINKQTVTVKIINNLLEKIPEDEKAMFNKRLIQEIYILNQDHFVDDQYSLLKIKEHIKGREILLLAPGKSLKNEKDVIDDFILKNDPIIISVNFIPEIYKCNFVFFSNIKRFDTAFEDMKNSDFHPSVIVTSNITTCENNNYFIVNYSKLLNDQSNIEDNAGLMLINLLDGLTVKKINLAGFDGFSVNKLDHFFLDTFINNIDIETLNEINDAIKDKLFNLSQHIDFNFVTKSIYETAIEKNTEQKIRRVIFG